MAKAVAKKKKAKKQQKKAVVRRQSPTTASVAASAGGTFVIMLDHLLKVHPSHFPITAQANSIAALQLVGQHNGAYMLVPRQGWRADLRENKDLVNAVNGKIDEGGIYEIVAVL